MENVAGRNPVRNHRSRFSFHLYLAGRRPEGAGRRPGAIMMEGRTA